jgi:uncharacterized protein YggE
MKTLLSATLLTLTLGAALAAAQTGTAASPLDNRVTASGTGEIRVTPDMALLTAEATFTRKTVKEAADEVRKAMDAILKAARPAVRGAEDLRTTRLTVNPDYEWLSTGRRFKGYTASQSIEITVRDLARVEKLTEALFATPMTGLGGLEMRHSQADSLRREALTLATRDARDNAAKICASVGRSCGDLLSARMAGTSGPVPPPMYAMEARLQKSDAGNGVPLQAGVLTFSAAVEADFRLK